MFTRVTSELTFQSIIGNITLRFININNLVVTKIMFTFVLK